MLPFRTQAVFNKRWFPLVLGVKARHNPAGGHEERPGRLANVFLCRLCGTAGHAVDGKCKFCVVGLVDDLGALPQGRAWIAELRQWRIHSASELHNAVA